MSWFQKIFLRRRLYRDISNELQAHLEEKVEELVARGMSRKDAAYVARREFGNLTLAEEDSRAAWRWPLEHLFMDVRYAWRMLRQNPAFTAAAVLAIALGVGLNVGIFSVLNGFALRLLPIPRAEQILTIAQTFHGHFSRNVHGEGSMFSYPEYVDYRDHNHVFSGLVAYEPFLEATVGGGKMQHLLGTAASCNYFEVLGEHPAQGRGFLDSDCAAPGQNAVVIISDTLWRGVFAADPAVIGKRLILNRTAFTVAGITRPGFTGTDIIPSSFWIPVTMQEALEVGRHRLEDENLSWLALLGRVRTGATLEQVRADLGIIAARLDQLHPGRTTSLGVRTATLFSRPEERKALIPIASVILAAFGLVLLIACANVANLLLARASVRQKEIALRLSIGASRGRLVRQLLTESLLLSLLGGTLGSLLAFWSFAGITPFVTSHLPHEFSTLVVNVAPDVRVLGYALAITLITGIVFGLIPALKSSRFDLNTALQGEAARSGRGKKGGRFLRNALVGAQVAVCMVLLLAAGLLLRALYYAQTVDPGFEIRGVAQVFLDLQTQGYDENGAAAFVGRLRDRVAGLPGVVEIANAECAPLAHDFSADTGWTVPGRADKYAIEYNHVSPEYFSLIGIPIVHGRGFTPADAHDTASVIIVTESTAWRVWPGEDPLGKTLKESTGREDTVIGVAKDAQVSHLGDPNGSYLYFPAGPRDRQRTYVLVRYAGDYRATANAIRDAVHSIDPDMPVEVTKLEDNLEVWRMPSRIAAALSGALGALGLLLASIGVYGMVSYNVSRSVREIGIRMALGADNARLLSEILRRAIRPVFIGALVGILACAGVSWVLSSMLFGLSAHDPMAFVFVPLFLLLVTLIASYFPARRALRVDPMVALRYE